MEAAIFMVDALAIVILVITGLRNDRRKPGDPITGIFRYHENVEPLRQVRPRAAYLQDRK